MPTQSTTLIQSFGAVANNVALGGTITLNAQATNPNAGQRIEYVWKKNGSMVGFTTNGTFSIPNAQSSHTGQYSVTVTTCNSSNIGEFVQDSSNVTITVGALTPMTLNITNFTQSPLVKYIGDPSFGIVVQADSNTSIIHWQWYKNNALFGNARTYNQTTPDVNGIANGTNSSWIDGMPTTAASAGTYRCFLRTIINNDLSPNQKELTSPDIVVEIRAKAPIITNQSADVLVSGSTSPIVLSVTATKPTTTGVLVYVWRKNGNIIQGANASALSLPNNASSVGNYDVIVANQEGSISSSVTSSAIMVSEDLVITSQSQGPINKTTNDESFEIFVAATAPAGYSIAYQWFYNGSAMQNRTTPTNHIFGLINTAQSGNYTCVVTATKIGSPILTKTSAVIAINISEGVNSTPVVALIASPINKLINDSAFAINCIATASGTVSYKWYLAADAAVGPGSVPPNIVPLATTSALSLTPSVLGLGAKAYACHVFNPLPSGGGTWASSNVVTVNITEPASTLALSINPFCDLPTNKTKVKLNVVQNGTNQFQIKYREKPTQIDIVIGTFSSPSAVTDFLPTIGKAYVFSVKDIVTNQQIVVGDSATAAGVNDYLATELCTASACPLPIVTVSANKTSLSVGETLVLTGVVSNYTTLVWRKNNIVIPGITGLTLTVQNLALTNHNDSYTLHATNACVGGTATQASSTNTVISVVENPVTTTPPTTITRILTQSNTCNKPMLAAVSKTITNPANLLASAWIMPNGFEIIAGAKVFNWAFEVEPNMAYTVFWKLADGTGTTGQASVTSN
jgi:hypothetical protein